MGELFEFGAPYVEKLGYFLWSEVRLGRFELGSAVSYVLESESIERETGVRCWKKIIRPILIKLLRRTLQMVSQSDHTFHLFAP